MNFVALVSGGKDSVFTAIQCIAKGHKLLCLANLHPATCGETDSFMYQTVGSEMVQAISEAIGVPLFRREITGSPLSTELTYTSSPKDEVEDLYALVKSIKEKYAIQGTPVQAVCAGAILSAYQKARVENICKRLDMQCLAPLWQVEQEYLLKNAVLDWGVDAIITKVCTLGLDKKHLGGHLKDLIDYLQKIKKEYGVSVCGEGGEYESLVLDSPLYKKRIVLDETEVVTHSESVKYHLEDKVGHEPIKTIEELNKLHPLNK